MNEQTGDLATLVLGANEAVDYLLPLPMGDELRGVASALQDVLPITDGRLRIRLLFSTTVPASRMGTADNPLGNLAYQASGWYSADHLDGVADVRFTLHSPRVGMVIVDRGHAMVVEDAGGDGQGRAQLVSDPRAMPAVLSHYEHLWDSASLAHAQGEILYEELLGSVLPQPTSQLVVVSNQVWGELLQRLGDNPEELHKLSPRDFERLVADLLEQRGYAVELTQATRDGGKDILVAAPTELGEFIYLVECKRYAPTRPVGVSLVRELYGVVEKERATAGLIVTSSYFTREAMEFREPIRHRMSLRDYNDIAKWIRKPR